MLDSIQHGPGVWRHRYLGVCMQTSASAWRCNVSPEKNAVNETTPLTPCMHHARRRHCSAQLCLPHPYGRSMTPLFATEWQIRLPAERRLLARLPPPAGVGHTVLCTGVTGRLLLTGLIREGLMQG